VPGREPAHLVDPVAHLGGDLLPVQVQVHPATGQVGELVLSGIPDRRQRITVRRITPVATQRDGMNLFEVEAAIEGGAPPGLRPGMEGVGKVVVGERSLLWIWTHQFIDWLRLALWRWMP